MARRAIVFTSASEVSARNLELEFENIRLNGIPQGVSGTANQVTVTDDGDGTITLATPQDIHTGASPTFANCTAQSGGANTVVSVDNTGTGGRNYILASSNNSEAEGGGKLRFRDATGSATRMVIDSSGRVGIGITSPAASAILDVTSTSKGFLPPRLTTTERDNITSPATGLVIYNTTTNTLQFYNGTTWGDV